MEILFAIGGFVLGVLFVLIIGSLVSTTGFFSINEADPEEDYMKLHLDNQDHLFTKKYILLKIVRTSNNASK